MRRSLRQDTLREQSSPYYKALRPPTNNCRFPHLPKCLQGSRNQRRFFRLKWRALVKRILPYTGNTVFYYNPFKVSANFVILSPRRHLIKLGVVIQGKNRYIPRFAYCERFCLAVKFPCKFLASFAAHLTLGKCRHGNKRKKHTNCNDCRP